MWTRTNAACSRVAVAALVLHLQLRQHHFRCCGLSVWSEDPEAAS
eukprot:COSAG02_NODE_3157_length_7260_cov_20.933808_4_plen_45_part_00